MLTEKIIADAKAHALAEYPKEACGLVRDGVYVPCENVAENPTETFRMNVGTESATDLIHSHPLDDLDELSCPSADDMTGQMSMAIPWWITDTDGTVARDPYVFGTHLAKEPLYSARGEIVSYEFHHGVRDCYTAVRRWFWNQRGTLLVEQPRDIRWWETNENLYVEGLEKGGFERLPSLKNLQDGDVVFGKVGDNKVKAINHAGVYLDNKRDGKGLIYHHLPGRLARRESAGAWINRASFAARYHAD